MVNREWMALHTVSQNTIDFLRDESTPDIVTVVKKAQSSFRSHSVFCVRWLKTPEWVWIRDGQWIGYIFLIHIHINGLVYFLHNGHIFYIPTTIQLFYLYVYNFWIELCNIELCKKKDSCWKGSFNKQKRTYLNMHFIELKYLSF